ncbi:hypothetical protein [Luteolibacter sp. LG18]|uniref:hypothetical protein n=1 Tax=Luteolibacter sp. LG18 TaxID=2819286 RepID=UPI002B2A0430|nr:hypothetical protein llg_12910 [Luteolibacter sp. LG18]
MKITNQLLTLAACTVLAATASAADETYVLAKKDHTPKAGSKHVESKKMAMKNGTLKVKAGEQAMEGTCAITETETEAVEYVSADKVKRLMTVGEKSQKMTMNGQELPDEPHPNPLLKVPVTLTKADGEWTATLDDGKEPTDEQETALSKHEKNMDKSESVTMYGTEPRKVGDTWTVKAADMPFAQDQEDTEGSVKLTFKAVEDYQGKKCAHLEGPMEIKGKSAEGQSISLKGNVIVYRSIEDLVDLKVSLDGKMEMSGDIPNGSMSMNGDMTMEFSTKVE